MYCHADVRTIADCTLQRSVCNCNKDIIIIPGAARLGRRPRGVAHSKITRVRVLSWPLPMITSLYFLTVTKSCHTKFPIKCDERLVFVVAEVVSNQFKATK